MAEARVSVDLDQFNCSICLDLLKDPVSINCGHSFCMICIKTKWDGDDQRGVYSCPLCRTNFRPRPVLGRNTMLAEMVEKLKKVHVAEESPAGPGDVECDVCVGQKHKAVKTCLVCLASYCGAHFRLHNELNPGNKHRVIEASANLTDRVCPHHNKLKEVFCHTDQKFVCHECAVLICRDHETNTVQNERSRRELEFPTTKAKFHQRAQEIETRQRELRQVIQSTKSSAKTVLDQSEKTFARLMRSIENKRSEVADLIRTTEEAEVRQAEEILKCLEKEAAKLKKRDTELTQLPLLEDDFLFVKTAKSLLDLSTLEHVPNISINVSTFTDLQNTVSEITTKVEAFCTTELDKISTSVKIVPLLQTSVPMTRDDFLKHLCQLTADETTVHNNLQLSEGKSRITYCETPQQYPHHDRFQYHTQALCGQVTGRCYWEVEWGGPTVYIAATYINTHTVVGCSFNCGFGHNEFSWSLCCRPSQCSYLHDDKETVIPEAVPSRVGVYLDQEAGILAFYSVTDVMTLLYRVQTRFTEPVYAGFWVFAGSYVKICENIRKIPTVSGAGRVQQAGKNLAVKNAQMPKNPGFPRRVEPPPKPITLPAAKNLDLEKRVIPNIAVNLHVVRPPKPVTLPAAKNRDLKKRVIPNIAVNLHVVRPPKPTTAPACVKTIRDVP